MSFTEATIKKAKKWDEILKRVIGGKTEWRIPAPTITEHFNRMYGTQKTTIWLSWENQSFEIGLYFLCGVIEFGVQENDPDKKQFWVETYTLLSENYISFVSKSITRNIEYIYLTFMSVNPYPHLTAHDRPKDGPFEPIQTPDEELKNTNQ